MGVGGVEWERRHLCAILGGKCALGVLRGKRWGGKWHLAPATHFPHRRDYPQPAKAPTVNNRQQHGTSNAGPIILGIILLRPITLCAIL